MNLKTQNNFWRKVNKTDTCWEWTAHLNEHGYGVFAIDRIPKLAHRVAVILDGRDPTNLCVLHQCDNPKCVRPDHLFLGTPQDNIADMVKKGRNKTGCVTSQPKLRKLTDDQVRYIRSSSETKKELGAKFNVSVSVIQSCKERKTYKEI